MKVKEKKKKTLIGDFIDFNTTNNKKVPDRRIVKSQLFKNNFAVSNRTLSNKSLIKLTLSKSANFLYNSSNTLNLLSIPSNKSCTKSKKCKTPQPCTEKKSNKTKKLNCNISEKSVVLKYSDSSSTVLRFKLDNDEINPDSNDLLDVVGNFMMDSTVKTRKELTWKRSSVYDFHDGSNESDQSDSSINNDHEKIFSGQVTNPSKKKLKIKNDIRINDSNLKKNGIDNLLEASVYTLNAGSVKLDNV